MANSCQIRAYRRCDSDGNMDLSRRGSKSAVRISGRKEIVELKKYLWLVKMPDGPDLLWQEKQFDILFQNRNRLNGWSEEETCKKLCSCPEGCEFLYQAGKSGRDILLSHGCFEPFRKHGEWTFLIRKKRPDAVD